MSERYAIYFAPDRQHPLWAAAAQWLGRDPSGAGVAASDVAGLARAELDARSLSARRYGFHATIKAPMRLGSDIAPGELASELERFVAARAPVLVGRMELALLDGFLALVPVEQSSALTGFAAEVVEHFDRFRAPLEADDRRRRLAGGALTPRQTELLDRYGYPYVLEQFQFHMTLTDRLPRDEQAFYTAAAARHFGALAEAELRLDRLVLFEEPQAGQPFVRGADYLLAERSDR